METWYFLIIIIFLGGAFGAIFLWDIRCPKCWKFAMKRTGNMRTETTKEGAFIAEFMEVRCQKCGYGDWRETTRNSGIGC